MREHADGRGRFRGGPTGSSATVKARLRELLARHQPDELIVTGMIHDRAARLRSFEIASNVLGDLRGEQAGSEEDQYDDLGP